MFPSNWDAYSGPNRKKPKTFLEQVSDRAADHAQAKDERVGFVSDLYSTIRRSLHQDAPAPDAAGAELDMDHILSRVPYRDMLENLFADTGEPGAAPDLPIITKVYEESFMRQPAAGERPCAMGEQCECRFVDRQAPFTAVEFRLPGDPETPQLCVLCSRRATQKMFYDMCYAGKAPKAVIQRYGNIFGQPGEYSAECMLVCPQGLGLHAMPLPCMSHQRSRYSVATQGSVKSLRQHRRLQPGGAFKQLPPACVSEGEHETDPASEAYVPASPALDAHVRRVHWLAREGRIDAQTAERHLNAHLAAASLPPEAARLPWVRWLAMPLTDAPQFGNLPDLWPPLHQALSAPEFRAQPGLPGLILQTLPCFRRPAPSGGAEPCPPPAPAEGLAPVLINLALALLLGLYPDATAKPQFRVRARVFGSLHAVLTAGPEAQERFVRARLALATLALMEYLARVLPACMPVEEEFLRQTFGMGAFFEQVPLLCSEFRSALAGLAGEPGWRPLAEADWAELDARAAEAVERAARVKRKPPRPCEPRRPADEAAPEWRTALACPAVPSGSPDDYKILAHAYGLPNHGADVERFHALIQLGRLPQSLLQLQREALARQSGDWRCVWMRARLHMCPACLARRSVSVLRHELRVDTLSGRLACSDCRCPEVLAVDLLASSALYRTLIGGG